MNYMVSCVQYALLFIIGAALASFLNVVVLRLPQIQRKQTWQGRRISLSYPPSRCMSCETPLKWRDNVPVVGWIKRRGKCRHCQSPFSGRYALFEGIGGSVFIAPVVIMGDRWENIVLGGVALLLLYLPSITRASASHKGR